MKKTLIVVAVLMMTFMGQAQLMIRGSIEQGPSTNKARVVLKSVYTSAPGEYINFLQFAVAVPASGNSSLAPTVTPLGNFAGFAPSAFEARPPYVQGSERIFSYILVNLNTITTMSWTLNTAFPVCDITFAGGGAPAKVKLVDFSNQGGDGNTFFAIATTNSANDPTDYGVFFFTQLDPNGSTLGTYPVNLDRFIETNLLISLPVNLVNFSGYKNGGKNTLNWTVTSEVNNRGFEVQRSTDGVNYSSIGFVNSQVGGYTNSEIHYSFDDMNPAGKKQYYRLNQKDIDGNSKLSGVVVLTRDKPTELGIGGLFPNPARDKVNVIIDAPARDKVTVIVTDMAGKIVKQQQENVDTGSNTVGVDIANLASGSYLVKLKCQSSDCETASAKFNKQ
jgi:Secretion system C-terminal sorting domain